MDVDPGLVAVEQQVLEYGFVLAEPGDEAEGQLPADHDLLHVEDFGR